MSQCPEHHVGLLMEACEELLAALEDSIRAFELHCPNLDQLEPYLLSDLKRAARRSGAAASVLLIESVPDLCALIDAMASSGKQSTAPYSRHFDIEPE